MEQRDYLKREIDRIGMMIGGMISYLLRLEPGAVSTHGMAYVNQTLKRELDLDMEELSVVEPDRLIDFLLKEKGFNADNLDKLLEMLFVIADDMSADNPLQDQLYGVCLTLNEYVEKTQKTVSFERYMKVRQMKQR